MTGWGPATTHNNGLPQRALTRPCPPLRSGTCLRHVGNPGTVRAIAPIPVVLPKEHLVRLVLQHRLAPDRHVAGPRVVVLVEVEVTALPVTGAGDPRHGIVLLVDRDVHGDLGRAVQPALVGVRDEARRHSYGATRASSHRRKGFDTGRRPGEVRLGRHEGERRHLRRLARRELDRRALQVEGGNLVVAVVREQRGDQHAIIPGPRPVVGHRQIELQRHDAIERGLRLEAARGSHAISERRRRRGDHRSKLHLRLAVRRLRDRLPDQLAQRLVRAE